MDVPPWDSEATPAERAAWLDRLLAAFVAEAERTGNRQRGPDWYRLMATTVGGSELAALLRMSPYASFYDVVASKVAGLRPGSGAGFGGREACWWGTLFEGVTELAVAVDLGATLRGSEICIQPAPGHRVSPDGYAVVRVIRDEDGPERIWTSDSELPEDAEARIALLEFKCPYTRRPDGRVPRNYLPQLWSGLAASPLADFGLFVDSVYRKCSLDALGPGPDYDREYHSAASDREGWGEPLAWGLIAVYAPRLAAPRSVRLGWRGAEWAPGDPSPDAPDADAALAAWQIHSAYLGMKSLAEDGHLDAMDLGGCAPRLFNQVLGLVNSGRFPHHLSPPCFADGRGGDGDVARLVDGFYRETPQDHWLLGLLPWKLFEIDYATVARQPDFFERISPLVAAVHEAAAAAAADPDPDAWLARARAAAAPEKRRASREEDARPAFLGGAEAEQDLFDAIVADADSSRPAADSSRPAADGSRPAAVSARPAES